ncbi:CHAP domain-containing protein [Herbidospora mongoliensis]|uniref:CHAP domain-containing protein n=1 Tax=Herbidospora mongoliensis TaxID=688067 RepID=UPI000B1F5A02|nr:CHAP domain-containing protein [Herbidospora mongoliensis]
MTPEMQKIITLLRQEIGYREQGGGYTKFGDWYNAVETDSDYSYQPWCDMFLSWGANQLGYSKWFGEFSYTVAHAQWFQAQGAWGREPEPGAVVFFDWNGGGSVDGIDHVGLVTKVDGEDFTSIEGNSGNMVKEQTHDLGAVVGFGYPEKILEQTTADTDSGAAPRTDSGRDSRSGSDTRSGGGSDTRPGIGSHDGPGPRPGIGPDDESGPRPGIDDGGPWNRSDTGSDSRPEHGPFTRSDTGPGSETGTGSDIGPLLRSDTESGSRSESKSGTGFFSRSDLGPGLRSDTRSGGGSEHRPGIGSDSWPGNRSDPGSDTGSDTGPDVGWCVGSDTGICPGRSPLITSDIQDDIQTDIQAGTEVAQPVAKLHRLPSPKVILLKEMAAESPLSSRSVHDEPVPEISTLPVAAFQHTPHPAPLALSAQGLVAPVLVVLLAMAFLTSHRRPASSSAPKDYRGRHRR